jgi:hypothetical protein
MKEIIKLHKLYTEKILKSLNISYYQGMWISWLKGLIVGLIIMFLLSGCTLTSYTYDPIYEDHPHTTEVFWYTDYEIGGTPYFGYWSGFYYYYGIPHFYPWWYYYQYLPPHYYHTHTHITVICNNGHYVRDPAPNYRFDNKKGEIDSKYKTFNANKITLTYPIEKNIKTNVFPISWKSNNSTRINKYNNDFNQNNIKPNVNRNNNKVIRNNKINKNGGNNRTNRKPNR